MPETRDYDGWKISVKKDDSADGLEISIQKNEKYAMIDLKMKKDRLMIERKVEDKTNHNNDTNHEKHIKIQQKIIDAFADYPHPTLTTVLLNTYDFPFIFTFFK